MVQRLNRELAFDLQVKTNELSAFQKTVFYGFENN
jgi:hypothetical protein